MRLRNCLMAYIDDSDLQKINVTQTILVQEAGHQIIYSSTARDKRERNYKRLNYLRVFLVLVSTKKSLMVATS